MRSGSFPASNGSCSCSCSRNHKQRIKQHSDRMRQMMERVNQIELVKYCTQTWYYIKNCNASKRGLSLSYQWNILRRRHCCFLSPEKRSQHWITIIQSTSHSPTTSWYWDWFRATSIADFNLGLSDAIYTTDKDNHQLDFWREIILELWWDEGCFRERWSLRHILQCSIRISRDSYISILSSPTSVTLD